MTERKMQDIGGIQGLHWEENWSVDNGGDSKVVPFPTIRPVNIVFHGEQPFNYGHYGIHLGQEDRLTFLGLSSHLIIAYFIDCREGSPTLHTRFKMEFNPSSGLKLCIPPGVAHAFDSLEEVFTLNDYRLFLPDPEKWVSGNTEWNIENDVINLPMNIDDQELPAFKANNHVASHMFYQIIAKHQRTSIPKIKQEYPYTEDVTLKNGSKVRLRFQKLQKKYNNIPEWDPIAGIDGVGWARNLVVWSGDYSGFVPLLDERSMYIIDHGEEKYSHDAFGVHLGQEDHLTFLGPNNHTCEATLVDFRKGSNTLHKKIIFKFTPNAHRYLVIPNGVAHGLKNMEKVFTINRPKVFVTNEDEYEPGNDVIDWSLENKNYPEVNPHSTPASKSFYARQVSSQLEIMSSPPMHSTPMVFLTKDKNGKPIRVALRKQVKSSA